MKGNQEFFGSNTKIVDSGPDHRCTKEVSRETDGIAGEGKPVYVPCGNDAVVAIYTGVEVLYRCEKHSKETWLEEAGVSNEHK